MMGTFAESQWFEVVHCYKCSMAFAMPLDFQRRRLKDRGEWFCPAGHGQVYTGKSEAEKLREQLDRSRADLERKDARIAEVRRERDHIAKAHKKMRTRIVNGVCPCCNRSFENLRSHMATQHPDYGSEQTLRALRLAFGMTQVDVASEAGTKPNYVSMFENGKPVPVEARSSLDWWLESHGAA